MKKEEFVENWMPDIPYGGEKLREKVKKQFEFDINKIVEEGVEDFCYKHDLCPICITGGWTCNSEHK